MVALSVEVARAVDGFGPRLEQVLNGGNSADLAALVAGDQSSDLERRYARFSKEFPEARWSVRPADSLKDGRPTFEVTVNGAGEADGLRYRLEASQRLALSIEGGRILDQQLLEEQSLLRSGDQPLPVSLEILNLYNGAVEFTGGIPSEWCSMTNLKELKMVACGLDGESLVYVQAETH